MRPLILLVALGAAAVQAQPGESAHAAHAVASCCATCSSGMCSADSTAAGHAGGCCAGMHGAGTGHEGHAESGEGMSCCSGMHGGPGHMDHGSMHGAATYGASETPAHAAVRAAVVALFDAMRAGSADGVRAAFHPGATLTSVGAGPDSLVRVRTEPIDGFATFVGEPHPEPYDERIGAIEVRVDGPLATAWNTYRFYVGDTYSHCGVDAFQLADTGEGWKIISVTDTRRPACEGTVAE